MLVSLQAQEIYTTGNIPKVHLQDKTRYVCNPAGILSAPACDEIDRMLYALEQQTGIETVVAVIPSIGVRTVSTSRTGCSTNGALARKERITEWLSCW